MDNSARSRPEGSEKGVNSAQNVAQRGQTRGCVRGLDRLPAEMRGSHKPDCWMHIVGSFVQSFPKNFDGPLPMSKVVKVCVRHGEHCRAASFSGSAVWRLDVSPKDERKAAY